MDDGSAHRASPVGCTAPAMASTDAPIETQMESHRDMTTHKGECFCGAVRIEVTGTPEGMGYCHCRSCRSWSAGPVNAFALWKTDAVRVTAGAEHLGVFQKTPISERHYCKICGGHVMNMHAPLGLIDVFAAKLPTLKFVICGGHVMNMHAPLGLIDVFAAKLPTLKFVPQLHVNYGETVLPMRMACRSLRTFPESSVVRASRSRISTGISRAMT